MNPGKLVEMRVLVVEDSVTVRKRLVEILESDPDMELVGEAEDGNHKVERNDTPPISRFPHRMVE